MIVVKQGAFSVTSNRVGLAGIIVLFIILLVLIGAISLGNLGFIEYQKQQNVFPTVTPIPGKSYTQAEANGSFSKSNYSVNITLNFALEGGSVTGVFSGDCNGNISGNYDGKDNGIITGKAVGSCSPFGVPLPASATFTGNVSHTQKTVSINGRGSAAGFSGEGSMALHY